MGLHDHCLVCEQDLAPISYNSMISGKSLLIPDTLPPGYKARVGYCSLAYSLLQLIIFYGVLMVIDSDVLACIRRQNEQVMIPETHILWPVLANW